MQSKLSRLGLCNPAFDVVPLKEMIDKNDAGSWGSDPVDVSMNVVRSTNFNDSGYLDLSDVAKRFLEPAVFEALKLEENEILIERSGGSETQPVGRVSFITKDVAEQGFAYANFIQRISVKSCIDPKYLFYCLYQMHSAGFTQIMQNQTNGIRNLEYRFFLKQLLPKPEFPEQQKIASILSSVDDTIKATRTSIAKLERLKKSLMQNLLTGKMKPDGTWRNEDEFYMDEKFGKYPKDWAFGRVKDFFVLQRGHDLTDIEAKDGEYPVVKSNGISINHHEFKSRAPGVVTGRSGTIGNVFYIEKDFWPHNTTLYVKDFCGNLPRYVYYLLIFMRLDIYLAGTGVPTLNRNDIHRLRNTIPKTTNEQQEIVSLLDECGNNINVKIVKISKLEKLKKSLMQKLLTGQLRVR